ncbi:hypothetical protein SAMN05720606_101287 [Paenibacillus polysaccharolyticus]|uniref:Uncharacterized protein n=1 Tax=Paenibacillus polysaccharolyticus TaxID=582692 RepID=A0A1G5BA02_9BACL|nr:hypothetical protein SAMN05720606_101287 [Paenibacillus polysaccharolyticus]
MSFLFGYMQFAEFDKDQCNMVGKYSSAKMDTRTVNKSISEKTGCINHAK